MHIKLLRCLFGICFEVPLSLVSYISIGWDVFLVYNLRFQPYKVILYDELRWIQIDAFEREPTYKEIMYDRMNGWNALEEKTSMFNKRTKQHVPKFRENGPQVESISFVLVKLSTQNSPPSMGMTLSAVVATSL
jgi:hypothetical protein